MAHSHEQTITNQDSVYLSRLTAIAFQTVGMLPVTAIFQDNEQDVATYRVFFPLSLNDHQKQAFQNAVENAVNVDRQPLGLKAIVMDAPAAET